MRGVRPFPLPHCLLVRKLKSEIGRLGSMLSLRSGEDDRGRYTSLRSDALLARARGVHEPWSAAWIEAEATKLIYRAVIDDRNGDRSLLALEGGDPWVQEEEVLERAERLIPLRLAELASR